MADLINRKVINTTLSKDNAEKLRTLSKRKGIPQTRVLDRAVDTLYQKEEASMEAKHKGIAICIANNKGGVGKTTSTAAFADLLSKRGKHVLVIDADPQGNLSGRFGYSADRRISGILLITAGYDRAVLQQGCRSDMKLRIRGIRLSRRFYGRLH